ncbi:DUF2142 domain-containing protein [Lactococcus nasutitermitis]|uniref:DUF2142 domain-containing protein n=1 Tax=Lactococcus nasutitermitis TaxID=1652957 RepID=A0ABV9JF53_9LACT|nr:DUF2142 domain-containing protein [Lactococcus nasutitermitis]
MERVRSTRTEKQKRVSRTSFGKIHRVYLILAIIIGVSLSLFMPLFNEPDGQYHYTVSTNMVGISNDISAYGEASISSGIKAQIPSYQSGNYFQKYFQNKIVKMPMKDLPRVQTQPSLLSYNFWGHIISAMGVWLGYHIYPSMGVMIVTARLLSTFICSLAMFFIIRFVKKGKLFFLALALSPVITNSFASLSYDALTYVLAAFAVAIAINMIVDNRVRVVRLLQMVVASIMLYLGAKTNIKLLIALFPLVILGVLISQHSKEPKEEVRLAYRATFIKKINGILLVVGGVIVLILGGYSIYSHHPSLLFSSWRLLLNYSVNLFSITNISQIFSSIIAAPYATINYMPLWVSGVWYVLLILILLTEEKFVKSRLLSLGALLLFLLGVLAVYFSYMNYFSPSINVTNVRAVGVITGIQGRYFTPTLLLFPLVFANTHFKIQLNRKNMIFAFSIIVIIISNILLLFGTLFGIYYL